MAVFQFDATQYEPKVGGTKKVFPPGLYPVEIISSEMKPPKSGGGDMAIFQIRLLNPDNAGDEHTIRLNVNHKTETVAASARSEFSAICVALGIRGINNTEEMHMRPFAVKFGVRTEQRKSNGALQFNPDNTPIMDTENKIEKYLTIAEFQQQSGGAATQAPQSYGQQTFAASSPALASAWGQPAANAAAAPAATGWPAAAAAGASATAAPPSNAPWGRK